MKSLEIDEQTNFMDMNTVLDMNEEMGRVPYHAVIKESLMLTDNEVMISFMKFMIGVAILNFPAQSAHLGILNGFLSTAIIVFLLIKSNENLVKAIPLELMNQNLTLSEISAKIFGHTSYQTVIDIIIVLCQGSNYILYLKYVGAQINQVVC